MNQKLTTFLLSLALTALNVQAATIIIPSKQASIPVKGEESVDPIPLQWPTEPRPKGHAAGFTQQFDGADYTLIRCSLPTVEFIVEPFGLWKNIPQGNRYSILLKSTDSTVTFGISQFSKNEFLASLDEDDWIRYTHFLKTSNPNLSFEFESSNLESRKSLYVLGHKYREVIYEVTAPKKKPVVVQEIFTFINDQLTVFTIRGAKSDVLRKKGATHAMICRMGYPDPEES